MADDPTQDNPIQSQPASLEQRSLGGMTNPQQTQDFLTALKQSGAGSNNSFMSSGAAPQTAQSQLIDPNSAYANNGSGPSSYNQAVSTYAPGNVYTPISATVANQVPSNITNNLLPSANLPSNSANSVVVGASSPIYNPYLNPSQNMNPQYQGNGINSQTSTPNLNTQITQPLGNGINNQTATPNLTTNVSAQQGNYNPYLQSQVYNPYLQQAQTQTLPYSPYTQTQAPTSIYNNLTMSDETQKTEIEPADNDTQKFLQALGVHSYEYKNKKHGVGRFVSPMAQELEKTEVGKSAVINTPEGKMVDYGRLGGITMSSLAYLNKEQDEMAERIQKLETYLQVTKAGK